LAGLKLENVQLRLLTNAMLKNNSLLGLHLCRKNLRDQDAEEITQILSVNTKLQKLELEGNSLGPNGMKSVMRQLETNKTLRFLDLESNPLTGLSKKELANPDKDTTKQDNGGIEAIGKMLMSNKKLLVLNLASTGIGEIGGNYLVSGMKENKTLISLELTDNALTIEQTREIQEYLNRNKKAYDEERLREFKERKLMHEEDSATENLVDIEEKKKEKTEIEIKNKQQRQDEREKKYAEMV